MQLKLVPIVLAFALIGAAPAAAGDRPPGNDNGPPGCEPSHNQPQKCDCPKVDHHARNHGKMDCPPVTPPGNIVVTPEPPGTNCPAGGIKIVANDQTFFVCNGVPGVQGPTGPAGPTGPQGPPGPAGAPGQTPTITVTQGPGANQITITVNGVPTVITLPTTAGNLPTCVNTRKSAIMGPLPRQFTTGMRVKITTKGHSQFRTVRDGRKVFVNTSNLPCGVYPIAVRSVSNPKLKPAWRIWSFTGGNTLNRFWFPGIPGFSNF